MFQLSKLIKIVYYNSMCLGQTMSCISYQTESLETAGCLQVSELFHIMSFSLLVLCRLCVMPINYHTNQAVSRSQNYFTSCHSHYLFCVDFVSCPSIITQTIKNTVFQSFFRTVFYDCSICHATSCNDVYFSSTIRNNISFILQGIPFLKTNKRNKDCLTTSLSIYII